MLNDTATEFKYGYTASSLKKYSNKYIICTCDYCKRDYETKPATINRGGNINKHACKNCSIKKAKESCPTLGFENRETQDKVKATVKKKYGVNNISQLPSIAEKKREKYRSRNNGKTLTEWAEEHNKSVSTISQLVTKYGLDEALKIKQNKSGLELFFENVLDKNNIVYETQKKIGDYIADIVIDDVVVELNGLYWHSDAIIKQKDYHINKRLAYEEVNLKPLFFYENEILHQTNIVLSILKNKLKQSNKIYARQCLFIQLDKKVVKDYLTKNHLMGNGQGRSFGLEYNGEIVSVMQVKKRGDGIEISRFCNALNTTVVGGFSKLLSNITKILNPSCIHTFIDKRYGVGSYLYSLGFIEQNTSISFNWTKNMEVLHRMKFPGNSGYKYGYNKIWDCGQTHMIKHA